MPLGRVRVFKVRSGELAVDCLYVAGLISAFRQAAKREFVVTFFCVRAEQDLCVVRGGGLAALASNAFSVPPDPALVLLA